MCLYACLRGAQLISIFSLFNLDSSSTTLDHTFSTSISLLSVNVMSLSVGYFANVERSIKQYNQNILHLYIYIYIYIFIFPTFPKIFKYQLAFINLKPGLGGSYYSRLHTQNH